MVSDSSSASVFTFGSYRLEPRERRLVRNGELVALEPKLFDCLELLVRRHGRLLPKDELIKAIWPDTIVEEGNLARNVSLLRKLLNASSSEPYIETVPKRGYRFVAAVREERPVDAPSERDLPMRPLHAPDSPVDDPADRADPPARSREGRTRRAVVALLAFAMALVAAAVVGRLGAGPPRDLAATRTVAVLPFRTAVDSAEPYLRIGLADVLITRLSGVSGLVVRPTSAVIPHAEGDALGAGRALGVDAVLEGSVQRLGERVRVDTRLLAVDDGRALWTYQTDVTGNDWFALQTAVAERVVGALALELSAPERARLASGYRADPRAFEAHLRGRYFWNQWNRTGLDKATAAFEEAIAIDPNYAAAWSGLSDSHLLQGYLGYRRPREVYPLAETEARTAIELDPQLAEAHLSLAQVRLFHYWDYDGAGAEVERSLALNPNVSSTHHFKGALLTATGQLDLALAERLRAHELDPTSAFATTAVGWVHYFARRHDEAIRWYRKALELEPHYVAARSALAEALHASGRHAEAIEIDLALRGDLGTGGVESLRAAFRGGGIDGYRRRRLELLGDEAANRDPSSIAWTRARLCAELGDADPAFEQLDIALDERAGLAPFLAVIPAFDRLRNDPRFAERLRRVGLPVPAP